MRDILLTVFAILVLASFVHTERYYHFVERESQRVLIFSMAQRADCNEVIKWIKENL